ncbi:MAG: peptide-methionine (S)-S-oxide reductase MsrA [Pseudomonadota bacterium]|nr:peptide-methionine (S)-S-oxide reductase MsrA [Pseudomonadota bacterium]MEC8103343.1 peptide-methionine (S)-S-oxide reductase MsrA [Pseudomonadota bacterium]MEC8524765.1 peptide-methionine (S)-S-oxide reductase MsrA [Pseudomonadota bacterium]
MWRPKMMQIPTPEEALPGRKDALSVEPEHFVNGRDIRGECPPGLQEILVGMGCFWGAERLFWQLPGVEVTSVGYGGGHTRNPTYDEVCSGHTGHTELVRIWFDPTVTSLDAILKVFWENHDPTQGMRQGNDIGTQYRSAIYTPDDAALETVIASRDRYQRSLSAASYPDITTELRSGVVYYLAETYHQQYLAKNPNGYCGLAGCQVSFPSS